MLRERGRLRRWELAVLVGVAAALLAGVWLDREQAALSDKVIRLHVIANSDTEADQALKLRVRDRILEEAAGYFQAGQTVEEAAAELTEYLPALAEAGAQVVREAGYDYPVSASLEPNVWFPTKTYTDFSLPAGSYTALRIVIGAGEGSPSLRQRNRSRPRRNRAGSPSMRINAVRMEGFSITIFLEESWLV